jgi:hypothetical protein
MKLISINEVGALSASPCSQKITPPLYRTVAESLTCLKERGSILEFISESEGRTLDITVEFIAIFTDFGVLFFNPSRKTDVEFHKSMDSMEPVFALDQLYYNVVLRDGSIHAGYSSAKVRKDKILLCGYSRNFENLKALARTGVNVFEELQKERELQQLRGVCYRA